MISEELAIQWIDGLDEDEVRSFTVKRLTGQDMTPVENAYASEPPEEGIVALLKATDLPLATRKGLIAGCRDVYAELIRQVASPQDADQEYFTDLGIRLCRVIDIVSPPEMRGHAYSLLQLFQSEEANPTLRSAAVRAAVGYPQTESDASLWESFLRFQECAAYAFNTLLKINPRHLRIEKQLAVLFRCQFDEGWPIDVPSLLRRAIRERASDEIATRLLESFRTAAKATASAARLWKRIETELNRRSWSRGWLDEEPVACDYGLRIDCNKVTPDVDWPFPMRTFKTGEQIDPRWYVPSPPKYTVYLSMSLTSRTTVFDPVNYLVGNSRFTGNQADALVWRMQNA